MNTNNLIGYILSGVGLVLIVLSSSKGQELIPIPISGKFILGAGALFVIAGIFLLTELGKKKKKKREVPIYEGKGKKRTIIGYQVENGK